MAARWANDIGRLASVKRSRKRGAGCEDESMTVQPAPNIVVIGAGVIGLSTGVCLAERGQRVEVRARLAPTQTTSAVASVEVPLIANCAGLGARELAGDDSVTPIRGQHVIVGST
jgi:glycine/D-amino acid oxidase-like deaminating enzyme